MERSQKKIKKVYQLCHISKQNDEKLIGFFSDRKKAEEVINKWKKFKGFKDYPEGFKIKTKIIGKEYYLKGFKSKCLK